MKTQTEYTGPVRVIDGRPVPYSATVQRQRADNGEWEGIAAISVLADVSDWMKRHRPEQKLGKIEGSYFFYGVAAMPNDQAQTPPPDSERGRH